MTPSPRLLIALLLGHAAVAGAARSKKPDPPPVAAPGKVTIQEKSYALVGPKDQPFDVSSKGPGTLSVFARCLAFGRVVANLEVVRNGDLTSSNTFELPRDYSQTLDDSGVTVERRLDLTLPVGAQSIRVLPSISCPLLLRVEEGLSFAEKFAAAPEVDKAGNVVGGARTFDDTKGSTVAVARVGREDLLAPVVAKALPYEAATAAPTTAPVPSAPVVEAPPPPVALPAQPVAAAPVAPPPAPAPPAAPAPNGAPVKGLLCIDSNTNGTCDPSDPTIGAPRLLLGDTLTEVALDGTFSIPPGADEVVIDSKDAELQAGLWLRDKVKVKPAELKPGAVVSVPLSFEVTARRSGTKEVEWGESGKAKATELAGYTFDAEPLRRKFGRKDKGPAPAPADPDVEQLEKLKKSLERKNTRLFATIMKDPKLSGADSDDDVGRITENLVRFLREKFELKVDDITVDVGAPVANRALVEVRVFQSK